MITPETLRFLQSDMGTELLAELKTADLAEANTLKLLTALRKRYSAENAAAALEMARLRIKAREKFLDDADQMFFTRQALEQASHWALRFTRDLHSDFGNFSHLFDLGCGIGADTRMFSQATRQDLPIIAVDIDPSRLAMAQANIAPHQEPSVHFLQADLTKPLPFTQNLANAAAFFDPARRMASKRIFSVQDYVPSLDVILAWRFSGIMVKLSPGVNLAELANYGGTVDFVSVNGNLKEAQLFVGALARPQKRAKVVTYDSNADHPEATMIVLSCDNLPSLAVQKPLRYLYEPDPAVIRTGLLSELAHELNIEMSRLDESIAYLTADTLVQSPLARAWIIDDWLPFNLKKLRAYLRERNVGRVTVKKRGSPITPEELIAKLRLPGDGEERVVVLTHVMGQPAVLICRTISA
jgi:SAM-dependent methyltransferase